MYRPGVYRWSLRHLAHHRRECLNGTGTCNAGECELNVEPEYTQDFEGLAPTPSNSLVDDGWLGFVNLFSPDGQNYLGGYVKRSRNGQKAAWPR